MFGKSQQINPHYKVAEVDRTFTTVAKPLLLQTSWTNESSLNLTNNNSPIKTPSTYSNSHPHSNIMKRTGDCLSFTFNANDALVIDSKVSQRMFRVLAVREIYNV